ncbi:hypothetical protein [Picosynechococcus sp. NKBG15041c]|uniref:hypothetical protein n=1 Tax=Picosynechococcus sp. NKBG15041c TaxID=1407650 RepID=UPI00041CCCE3|nr:hypothetical protein [Picosynechococcus sp. NKBG15041c]
MEVSTFELLVKRIAPPPAASAIARRVVQGYFLTISNLENEAFQYTLDFYISLPNPPNSNRTLVNNAVVLIDVAGANQPLTLTPTNATVSTTRFSTSFSLGARQTASVQLLPNLTPALLAETNPDLEVRGFVEIRLPAIFRRAPLFRRVPQSNRPVKVLLNPEIRGTFLPNNITNTADFDQINYPLALASGNGLNQIEPEPGGPILINPGVIDRLPQLGQLPFDFTSLSEVEQANILAEVMGQIDPNNDNLQNVNQLLSNLNIPIRMNNAS